MSWADCEKWNHYVMKKDQQLQYANTANNKTDFLVDKSWVSSFWLQRKPATSEPQKSLKQNKIHSL